MILYVFGFKSIILNNLIVFNLFLMDKSSTIKYDIKYLIISVFLSFWHTSLKCGKHITYFDPHCELFI